MAEPVQTMEDALITCDMIINNSQIVHGETVAQRVMNNIFDTNFMTCMNKTNADLEDGWNTYYLLIMAQGKIYIRQNAKNI